MKDNFFFKFHKVWRLIPKNLKKRTLIIFFITLLGTFLETIGISLVVPLIAIIVDVNYIKKYPEINDLFINYNQLYLPLYGVFLLLSVYIIKVIFLGYLSLSQSKFIYEVRSNFSNRLFSKYINEDYELVIGKNSSILMRNITSESQQLVDNFLIPSITLFTELTLIIFLISLLIYVEPFGALFIFLIFLCGSYSFQLITKKYLHKWGADRQHYEGATIKYAHEGLTGIKDVKIFGRESIFIKNFMQSNLKVGEAQQKQLTISQIPRLWFELLAVMALSALIVTIVLVDGKNTAAIVPIIGLFGAIAFRIMPSANRILTSVQALRYSSTVIDLLHVELQNEKHNFSLADVHLKFNKKIIIKDLSYKYPSSNKFALQNINFEINKGECIGIIGKSGSGKSTLVDLILGLLKPSNGKIEVDGINIKETYPAWRKLIGYVPQSIFLTDDSLRKNIGFGLNSNEISDEKINAALDAAQLIDFINGLPDGDETKVGERGVRLSGGQKQRIGIARALYHSPELLIFDEATSALDSTTELDVMNSILKLKNKRTIIIIAHRLSTIEKCDRVYEISDGNLRIVSK